MLDYKDLTEQIDTETLQNLFLSADPCKSHIGRDLNLAETPVKPGMYLTFNIKRMIRIFSVIAFTT